LTKKAGWGAELQGKQFSRLIRPASSSPSSIGAFGFSSMSARRAAVLPFLRLSFRRQSIPHARLRARE